GEHRNVRNTDYLHHELSMLSAQRQISEAVRGYDQVASPHQRLFVYRSRCRFCRQNRAIMLNDFARGLSAWKERYGAKTPTAIRSESVSRACRRWQEHWAVPQGPDRFFPG